MTQYRLYTLLHNTQNTHTSRATHETQITHDMHTYTK